MTKTTKKLGQNSKGAAGKFRQHNTRRRVTSHRNWTRVALPASERNKRCAVCLCVRPWQPYPVREQAHLYKRLILGLFCVRVTQNPHIKKHTSLETLLTAPKNDTAISSVDSETSRCLSLSVHPHRWHDMSFMFITRTVCPHSLMTEKDCETLEF